MATRRMATRCPMRPGMLRSGSPSRGPSSSASTRNAATFTSVAFAHAAFKTQDSSSDLSRRRFKSVFGVSPAVFAVLWENLNGTRPLESMPRHLLWSLLFRKVYATEGINSSIAGVDEKTFRKWTWVFIDILSRMNVVSYLFIIVQRRNCF